MTFKKRLAITYLVLLCLAFFASYIYLAMLAVNEIRGVSCGLNDFYGDNWCKVVDGVVISSGYAQGYLMFIGFINVMTSIAFVAATFVPIGLLSLFLVLLSEPFSIFLAIVFAVFDEVSYAIKSGKRYYD